VKQQAASLGLFIGVMIKMMPKLKGLGIISLIK
jgi:hypothetical protein